jgi:uncharacterized protein (DUF305 family)
MKITRSFVLALAFAGLASAAQAQDAMKGHDMAAMGQEAASSSLPDICRSGGTMDAMSMGGSMTMDEAHTALMAGMDQMNSDMMTGGMAADLDVAFVCSMIPHHQGAIDMAKAELQYGDNDWARGMAEKVIAAQEQEIADMLAWLAEQSK